MEHEKVKNSKVENVGSLFNLNVYHCLNGIGSSSSILLREKHTFHLKYIANSNALKRLHCWLLCLFPYFALPFNANIFPGNHFFARDIQTIPHRNRSELV